MIVIYFSRSGENYWHGGRRRLPVGNTKVLADMIAERVHARTFEITPANPYSDDYDATVQRNVEEERTDARPAIAAPLPDITREDTVLLGCPVWNSRTPMIMDTFLDSVDLVGKTVLPFVTHAVSGMSGIDEYYKRALPNTTVARGLAIMGEDVHKSGPTLDQWLRDNGLTRH
jgi:flavodoxin